MAKYAANAFHAAKIVFANEIADFSQAAGVDGRRVMDLLVQDCAAEHLARLPAPGLRLRRLVPAEGRARAAVRRAAERRRAAAPARASPRATSCSSAAGSSSCWRQPGKRVGVLGLSFKAGTDDLRESPVVQLVEALLGKGYEVRIYDGNVNLARVLGTNRDYIEAVVPHLADLMVDDAEQLLASCDTVVIGNDSPEFAEPRRRCRLDSPSSIWSGSSLSDEPARGPRRALLRHRLVSLCACS